MSGKAITAAEQEVRMQAASVRAQLIFLQSLREADQKNMRLVAALPTTSAGVLDTGRAEERAECARRRARRLTDERDWLMTTAEPERRAEIERRYRYPIAAQWDIVKGCQQILEKAQAYSRASLNVYRSVAVGPVESALKSAEAYRLDGTWGATDWVAPLFFQRDVNVFRARAIAQETHKTAAEQFMDGDLVVAESFARGEAKLSRGQSYQVAEGELLGFSASMTPYHKVRESLDKDRLNVSYGTSADAELSLARGSVTEKAGYLTAKVEGNLLTGAVSGTLGASLLSDGNLNPTFAASAESSGTVAEVAAKTTLGTGDYNASVKVGAQALTAGAEAGIALAEEGAEVCVGAEAYVAKGMVSGGVTFLGVNVVATVEAGVGGAGGKAKACLGSHAFEGELAVGLGIGVGSKVYVDWSGLMEACGNLKDSVRDWWGSITQGGEDDV